MSTVIPFVRATSVRRGLWSNQELAEFYRVEAALCRAGMAITSEHGLSDEGDPWFVFCQPNGEVIIHFARIDGNYIIASDVLDNTIRGPDFRALIDEIARLRPDLLPIPRVSEGTKLVVHPASVLAALVAAAALSLSPDDAQASQAGEDEHPSPAVDVARSAEPAKSPTGGTGEAGQGGSNHQPGDRKQSQAMIFAAMAFAAEAVASDHFGFQTDLDVIRSGNVGNIMQHAGLDDGLPGLDTVGSSSNGSGAVAQFASASAVGSSSSQQGSTPASANRHDNVTQVPSDMRGELSGPSFSESGHIPVSPILDPEAIIRPAASPSPGTAANQASARSDGLVGSSSFAPDTQGDRQENSASFSRTEMSGRSSDTGPNMSEGELGSSSASWQNGSGKTVATGASVGIVNRGSEKGDKPAAEAAQGDRSGDGNGKAKGHSKETAATQTEPDPTASADDQSNLPGKGHGNANGHPEGAAAAQADASPSASNDSQGDQSGNGKTNGHSKGAAAAQADASPSASNDSQGDQSGNGKANGHSKVATATQTGGITDPDAAQSEQLNHGNGKAIGHSGSVAAEQTATPASNNGHGDYANNSNGKAKGPANAASVDQPATASVSSASYHDDQPNHGNGKASHGKTSLSANDHAPNASETPTLHPNPGANGHGFTDHQSEVAPPAIGVTGDGGSGSGNGHGPRLETRQDEHASPEAHGTVGSIDARVSGSSAVPVSKDSSSAQPHQNGHQVELAQAQTSPSAVAAVADATADMPSQHRGDPNGDQESASHSDRAPLDQGAHDYLVTSTTASAHQAATAAQPDAGHRPEMPALPHADHDAAVAPDHANDTSVDRHSKLDTQALPSLGVDSRAATEDLGSILPPHKHGGGPTDQAHVPFDNTGSATHQAGGLAAGHVDADAISGISNENAPAHSLGSGKHQGAELARDPLLQSGTVSARSEISAATIDDHGNLVFQGDPARDASAPIAVHELDIPAVHQPLSAIGVSDHSHPVHDLFHHS
ncbi:hypothetical protein [Methylobacterium gnaphalii]|uniref:Uncharacterized protein n=1 Tax=Methylobacterium gnaphalii TaxID=1010610 RepID=A0A512JS43_9HYPH|nr:hypothetical protein [Methylobacterium gnaphalii]GEP12732.1 hypothetical protein MGN01_45770 [Methylobacterium gnaphalii]GJD71211.1 hypothetical protein MMMDOFMJ_4165 [Methylobacterium gnaphalii]GLS51341.1 hypothetical protein GCM10007885_41960 [Methylobacterium gnaphalii]